ncbi:hypothetical protein BaRGS_00023470 [Batillaria attramentaria]|uniref:Uncharacterized protein n=1 Tax=Batillaria attramentaria TaxID=370345 RepID=A0ABD0KDL5_9CAEN
MAVFAALETVLINHTCCVGRLVTTQKTDNRIRGKDIKLFDGDQQTGEQRQLIRIPGAKNCRHGAFEKCHKDRLSPELGAACGSDSHKLRSDHVTEMSSFERSPSRKSKFTH